MRCSTIVQIVTPTVTAAIGPLVAPSGTTAFSWLLDMGWNFAGVPLNVTAVVDFNAVPVIVTVDPHGPAVWESPVMLGAALRQSQADIVRLDIAAQSRPSGERVVERPAADPEVARAAGE